MGWLNFLDARIRDGNFELDGNAFWLAFTTISFENVRVCVLDVGQNTLVADPCSTRKKRAHTHTETLLKNSKQQTHTKAINTCFAR